MPAILLNLRLAMVGGNLRGFPFFTQISNISEDWIHIINKEDRFFQAGRLRSSQWVGSPENFSGRIMNNIKAC